MMPARCGSAGGTLPHPRAGPPPGRTPCPTLCATTAASAQVLQFIVPTLPPWSSDLARETVQSRTPPTRPRGPRPSVGHRACGSYRSRPFLLPPSRELRLRALRPPSLLRPRPLPDHSGGGGSAPRGLPGAVPSDTAAWTRAGEARAPERPQLRAESPAPSFRPGRSPTPRGALTPGGRPCPAASPARSRRARRS